MVRAVAQDIETVVPSGNANLTGVTNDNVVFDSSCIRDLLLSLGASKSPSPAGNTQATMNMAMMVKIRPGSPFENDRSCFVHSVLSFFFLSFSFFFTFLLATLLINISQTENQKYFKMS